jgi:hypothetical protein
MPRKSTAGTPRGTTSTTVADAEIPSLSDIIRAGAVALDIAEADVDMLEGLVIEGQVYDLGDTPELARAIRGMYVNDPDPVIRVAAGTERQVEDMGV